jgi:hypothetical protein
MEDRMLLYELADVDFKKFDDDYDSDNEDDEF